MVYSVAIEPDEPFHLNGGNPYRCRVAVRMYANQGKRQDVRIKHDFDSVCFVMHDAQRCNRPCLFAK